MTPSRHSDHTTPGAVLSLSVLVPVYNEQYLVQTALERLFVLADNCIISHVQVIVVGDGSTDRTPAALAEFEQNRRQHDKDCKFS